MKVRFVYSLLGTLLLQACTEKVSLESKKSGAESSAKVEVKAAESPGTDAKNLMVNANNVAMNETKKEDTYDGFSVSHALVPSPTKMETRILGEVSAIRNSKIAFRSVGFISSIDVKPGNLVKKGQVLASLDDRDFVLRLDLAKTKRDQAKVAMDMAKKELDREEQLRKEKVSTASAYDKIKTSFEHAMLSFRMADLELSVADLALKDTKLLAPYDCVIVGQMKYEGENVPAGTAVLEVSDTAEPEISLTAPERLMGSITVGKQLTVTVPSANYTGKAEVIRIVPVISQKTRTFPITAKLVQYNSKVLPGSYVEAILD